MYIIPKNIDKYNDQEYFNIYLILDKYYLSMNIKKKGLVYNITEIYYKNNLIY
jgi:hypothetical protein